MKSTSTRYGTIAVTIHWLTAALIVVLLISGFRAGGMTDTAAKTDLLALHAPLGLAILTLTLLRVAWWLFADTRPEDLPGTAPRQRAAARGIHLLLYVALLGMAASGIGMMLLSGAGEVVFGASGAALPDFREYLPRVPHGLGARLILALLALHVLAALWHHFVRRDGALARMWYGRG